MRRSCLPWLVGDAGAIERRQGVLSGIKRRVKSQKRARKVGIGAAGGTLHIHTALKRDMKVYGYYVLDHRYKIIVELSSNVEPRRQQ